MFDSGERMRTRNTFVGTPCWYAVNSLYVLVFGWFVLAKRDFFFGFFRMAPEVMQQVDGYDFKYVCDFLVYLYSNHKASMLLILTILCFA